MIHLRWTTRRLSKFRSPMTSYTRLTDLLVGELLLVANETYLTGAYFTDDKHTPKVRKDWALAPKHPVLTQATLQLHEYLRGKRTTFTVPLAPEGTEFQRKIWKLVMEIPPGHAISYSELADRAGMPGANRSVGTAVARSPLNIFIPAHRVIAQNGDLGGFAGKWNRKKGLLDLEGQTI
jgi:methylated-DNA-[protein]-cysteine S-methyltransferase